MSPSQQPGGAAAGLLINFLVAYEGSGRGPPTRPANRRVLACCNCAATGAAEALLHLHFKGQQPAHSSVHVLFCCLADSAACANQCHTAIHFRRGGAAQFGNPSAIEGSTLDRPTVALFHRTIRWTAATQDGLVKETGAVFEAKFMLPWS